MSNKDVFERVLHSYEAYYDINTTSPAYPFQAEATFQSHTEQYFLVKEAKLSSIESAEYVFFYTCGGCLLKEELFSLDETAWKEGLSRVKLSANHRNSDVTLVIIADKVDDDVFPLVKKQKHYKSYCFTFKGWSNYRVILLETSTKKLAYNRLGSSLKKIFSNI